jgi:CubicO group peptidase (beta-lactamase class C family)
MRRAARRAVAVSLVGAAVATGTTIAAPASHAQPGAPLAVFDPPSTSWASVRGLSSTDFATYFDQKVAQGYLVTDLDPGVVGGTYQVAAVFRKNPDGRGWESRRDLTADQFHAKWDELKDRGFRLIDQESYRVDGQQRYAGVWIENREHLGWASYRDVTDAEFHDKFVEYRDKGFLPIDVERYDTDDGVRFAAAWVDNVDDLSWRLRRGLSDGEFSSVFGTYADQGYRMLDVEADQAGGSMTYAGIWIENTDGRAWRERRDLTGSQFANWWYRYRDEGFRLEDVEAYDTPDGVRYAGIWRQNSNRPDWGLKGDVDQTIQSYLDDYDVPGISVAIMRQGKLVYERGFGDADVADDRWMHARSVNRLASISKAVAGTLLLDLQERGLADPADRADVHLPELPAAHTYTVEQLATNRSCIVSYPAAFSEQETTHYDEARDAVPEIVADPLGCTIGDYKYSTAGYSVLGATLESELGKPVDAIVRDELSDRYGLGTLRPEDRSVAVAHRTSLYADPPAGSTTPNTEDTTPDDLSWKVLGGGLESSAEDLVRFGDRVARGEILDDGSLDTMWTSPVAGGSYGYGWDLNTEDGRRVVAKSGGQNGAGTYIRMYPDQEVTIVVLSNRWHWLDMPDDDDDIKASDLGRELGALVIDDLA